MSNIECRGCTGTCCTGLGQDPCTCSPKTEPRYPDVHVQLTGQDGNIFNIIGLVAKALRRAPGTPPGEVEKFTAEVMDSEDYDAALRVVMRWVRVS